MNTETKQWVNVASLDLLPKDLEWSGLDAIPMIGDQVTVRMNGFGEGKVVGYFHSSGFLGVAVAIEKYPEWFNIQQPLMVRLKQPIQVFGREIKPLHA